MKKYTLTIYFENTEQVLISQHVSITAAERKFFKLIDTGKIPNYKRAKVTLNPKP